MKGNVSVFLEIHIFILGRFRIKPGKLWLVVFLCGGFFGFFFTITHSFEHKWEQGKTKEKQTII